MRHTVLATLIVLSLAAPAVAALPYQQVRGVIHLDTTVSGGDMDPEDMVRFIRDHGLEVAVFSDHITVRVEYGFFPARDILGRLSGWAIARASGRTGSVQNYGPAAYLDLLDGYDRKHKEITVIPGVEAIPFYYWLGSPFNGSLTMVNGYKHLLAFGMKTPEDYAGLPCVGNGFFRRYSAETILSLWPLVLLFFSYKSFQKARRSEHRLAYRIPAVLFLCVGLLFLLQNFPYKFDKYDQYHGDQGSAPYQDFIDYVVQRDGLVFWAHPEVSSDISYGYGPLKLRGITPAPYEDLLYLQNYTGFAALYEGMKYMIPPGGIWDQVLTQYCTGQREKPVWAIAEGDVEGETFSPTLSQTVFLVKKRTREDLLKSLKEGRMYALCGEVAGNLSLAGYALSSAEGATAGMGEILEAESGKLAFTARIECKPSPKGSGIKAELIRDQEVVQTYESRDSLDISFPDSVAADGRMHYYRIDARAPGQSRLISNPVFVRVTGPL